MTAPMTDEEWREKYPRDEMRQTELNCIARGLVKPDTTRPSFLELATLQTIPAAPRAYSSRERDIANPKIDGVFGTWLDEDGFVLPEYRERAAKARAENRRNMGRIEEVATVAQSRRY